MCGRSWLPNSTPLSTRFWHDGWSAMLYAFKQVLGPRSYFTVQSFALIFLFLSSRALHSSQRVLGINCVIEKWGRQQECMGWENILFVTLCDVSHYFHDNLHHIVISVAISNNVDPYIAFSSLFYGPRNSVSFTNFDSLCYWKPICPSHSKHPPF